MQAIYHVIHPDGTIDTDEVEWPPRPGRHAIETPLGPLLTVAYEKDRTRLVPTRKA